MKKIKILLFVFLILFFLVKKVTSRKLPLIDADIVIAPGGYRGVYVLGLCHYIKNHFDVTNKTFLGFSSGSFNSLFMTLDKEEDIQFIRNLFAMNNTKSISKMLIDIIDITKKIPESKFDLNRLQIGVSTPNGLTYYKEFLNMEDALYCCKCSSFVPFITYRDVFLFYKSKLTLDGGFYYRSVKRRRNKETLFIDSTMFGRYKPHMMAGLGQPKKGLYQLYLDGYHDARKNHAYFEPFFQSESSSPSGS